MVKHLVLVLDNKLCYFAKDTYYNENCQYDAVPYKNGKFFVIDLNNDGLKLDTAKSAIIRSYFPDSTYKLNAWVDKNEGILVVDGKVLSEVRPLMDNSERLNLRDGNSPAFFLSGLDYNKDNIIDADDIGFKALSLWVDDNQDMICDPEEVAPLSSFGIISIYYNQRNHCYQSGANECSAGDIKYEEKVTCHTNDGDLDLYGVTLLEYV